MRLKLLLSIFFLSLNYLSIAQKYDTLTSKVLRDYEYNIFDIGEFPKERLVKNSTAAFLAIREDSEGFIISLLFRISDSAYVRTSRITLTNPESMCYRTPYVNFRNDTLIAECNFMKGIMFTQKYLLKNLSLKFITSYMYDLNEEVFDEADKAYKNNDPVGYCQAYMGAQYYMDLDYRVKESLQLAYSLASKYYQKGDYKKAADMMLSMEQNCDISTSETISTLLQDEFKKMWGDASLYYLKADMYNECVNLAKWFIKLYPENSSIYLQYGDALFHLNNPESKDIYKKYFELMTSQGKVDKIPARVNERIK